MQTQQLLLIINDLSGGGAQTGIAAAISQGFFSLRQWHIISIIEGDGLARARFERLPNVTLSVLFPDRRMRPQHLLYALITYPKILRRIRPATVLASLPQANIIARAWAHFISTPLFVFEHSTAYARWLYAPILKNLSLPVRGVIADCQDTLRQTRRHYLRPSKISFMEMPLINLSPSPEMPRPYQSGQLKILTAGRLSKPKNFGNLIRAILLLRTSGTPATLTIYGSGELEEELVQLTQQLGLKPYVTFAGYDDNWLTAAPSHHIYAQPSLREGLCITLLEAMNAGLPTIATATGGVLDYGIPGRTYEPVQDPSPVAIAQAVRNILATPDQGTSIAKAASKHVRSIYSEASRTAAMSNVIHTIHNHEKFD